MKGKVSSERQEQNQLTQYTAEMIHVTQDIKSHRKVVVRRRKSAMVKQRIVMKHRKVTMTNKGMRKKWRRGKKQRKTMKQINVLL